MGIPRLVSPDDHIQEPAHVWETRLPARQRGRGPRIERLRGRCDLGAGDLRFVETGEKGLLRSPRGRMLPLFLEAPVGVHDAREDLRAADVDADHASGVPVGHGWLP